jgi:ABC-type multidrug transport system fused ATPase/permease subunit
MRIVLTAAWKSLTRREKSSICGVGVLSVVTVLLEMLSLGAFVPIVGIITRESALDEVRSRLQLVGQWSDARLLAVGLCLVVALFALKNCVVLASGWYQRTVTARVATRLSHERFRSYLKQPYSFHTETSSSLMIRDLQNASTVVTSGVDPLMSIVSEGLIVIGVVGLLLVVDPVVTCAVLAIFVSAGWIFNRTTRVRIVALGNRRNAHLGFVLREQQQALGGIKEILVSGRQETFISRHHEFVATNNLINRTYGTIQQLPRLWLEMLTVSGLATLIVVVVAQGRDPSDAIPLLGLFTVAVFRIQPSITRVLLSLQAITFASPVIQSLSEDLFVGSPSDEVDLVQFREGVRFSGVSYSYPSSTAPVLNNVSLAIGRNERVALAGPSGAGKSTLVDLFLGLLDPTEGEILVDGQEMKLVRRSWQGRIGYVPQHVFLLDDSIRRNVAFGFPDPLVSEEQVWRALRLAQLEGFVRSLPDGLDTHIGERGIRFSGGQQQRLGIARALYSEPPVLVFDEATSSLDQATERGVADAIAEVGRSRTVVMVAHRLSTLETSDRVLFVSQGRVEDLGPPTAPVLAAIARGGDVENRA